MLLQSLANMQFDLIMKKFKAIPINLNSLFKKANRRARCHGIAFSDSDI